MRVVVRDVGGERRLKQTAETTDDRYKAAPLDLVGQKVDVPVVKVDHKYLVGALIVGQGIGFLGSAIGGNEARKKAGGRGNPWRRRSLTSVCA